MSFTGFEKVEKPNSCFAVNSWDGCLLNSSYLCLSVKIFFLFGVAVLKYIFWESNFEVYPCSKKYIFFQHKATVWLNLVSNILFVNTNKTKTESIFYIFNFLFTLLIY